MALVEQHKTLTSHSFITFSRGDTQSCKIIHAQHSQKHTAVSPSILKNKTDKQKKTTNAIIYQDFV